MTNKVYAAIANVTKELSEKGISKDNTNKQQGYNFRGIDDIYNALSVTLANNKLCILPRIVDRSVTERQSRNGATLFYTTLTAEFDFVSAEDGSKHTVCTIGEAMDSADKSSNKAMSAAYKYACLQTFCIPTEGDNDADATTHEVTPRTANENPFGEKKPTSKAACRDVFDRLVKAVRNQKTLTDFNRFFENDKVTQAVRNLPQDWYKHFSDECAAKEAELRQAETPDNNPFNEAAE